MNMKHCMAMAVCVALARYLCAGSFFPLPSTNAIVLNFDNEIPEAVRETIRLDFDRCLIPSVSEIELYHSDRDPTNRLWAGRRFNKRINGENMTFMVPDSYPMIGTEMYVKDGKKYISVAGTAWFTNLDHGRRLQPLQLMTMAQNIKPFCPVGLG